MRALHPIQVQIIRNLYENTTSLYKIAEKLNIPYPKLIYHVSQLYKKGLLVKTNKNEKIIYRVNKKVVKITYDKKGNIIIWLKLPRS